ncbi:MAG TPA: SDR family NAD(P)-dependent oxidoreductase [Alphaproteobacteria bacterium]|jgi:NAD(P)-dependent dehydrogenase (short-subunit alcohol dehydrogenase family)
MKIAGMAALVTGGASGLGAATARMLAAKGARVGILDLEETKGAAVAAECGGVFARTDVADEGSAKAAIEACAARHGGARILVCCAGIGTAARIVGREGPMPLAAFERVIHVNLIGTFNTMRLAAAAMQALDADGDGERGAIVLTASVAAFEGQIGQAAYAASKGGIAALTLPAAREFARSGIRVVTIAPGLFETPLLGELPQETRAGLAAAIPFPQRLGLADEFAALAVHIVENSYLNGETIRLDGALRMAPR